jgi:hypothetical protein
LLTQATGQDLGPFVTLLQETGVENNEVDDDDDDDDLARQPRVIGTGSRYSNNALRF